MGLTDPHDIATVLCDLDGVVWLAHEPIPGAVEAIAAIRATGRRVLFVTNNSAARLADHVGALGSIGVEAHGDVVSSAMAAGRLVRAGERVLVSGGPGIVEAVAASGATPIINDGADVSGAAIDAVIVGLHRDFDYARLAAAAAALHGGARLIGTNSDPTYPTPRGLEPGGGSLLAAVASAGEAVPEVAGKPHPPMAALIAEVVTAGAGGFDPRTALMVGDRADTDGDMAAAIGCQFVLVRTGVTPPGAVAPDVTIALDVAGLSELAAHLDRGP